MVTSVQSRIPSTTLDCRLVVACSVELARARQFGPAKSLLAHFPHEPAALDLLARIYLQSGDMDIAREYWQQVVLLVPGHAASIAALNAFDRRGHWQKLRYRYQLLTVIVLICTPILFATSLLWSRYRTHPTQQPVVSLATTPKNPSTPSVRGVSSQAPLFKSGIRLAPQGYDEVIQLAQELRATSTDRVEVIGKADRVPLKRTSGFRSNRDLAIARAATIGRLLEQAGIDRGRISLQYDLAPLDRNEPGRSWRTVQIRITKIDAKN